MRSGNELPGTTADTFTSPGTSPGASDRPEHTRRMRGATVPGSTTCEGSRVLTNICRLVAIACRRPRTRTVTSWPSGDTKRSLPVGPTTRLAAS